MLWYQVIAWCSLCTCIVYCIFQFVRLIRLGSPVDYSSPRGSISSGVVYSFTGAMNPVKKESAFLHLPTYMAGILYHLGTFLSIFLFFLFILNFKIEGWLSYPIAGYLVISGLAGVGIFIKRILKKELRSLSNPDDYLSNLLVTIFQVLTMLIIFSQVFVPIYYIIVSLLLLYLPVGKLKHAIYFFAARYHLGFFFGRRGVWPPK